MPTLKGTLFTLLEIRILHEHCYQQFFDQNPCQNIWSIILYFMAKHKKKLADSSTSFEIQSWYINSASAVRLWGISTSLVDKKLRGGPTNVCVRAAFG